MAGGREDRHHVAEKLLWARANPWHGPLCTCSTWPHRGAAFFRRGQAPSRETATLPQVNCSWPRAALWPFPSHPCAGEAASFSDRAVVSAGPPPPLPLALPPGLTSLFPDSAFPEVSTPPPIKLNFASDSVFRGIQAETNGTLVQGKVLAQTVSTELRGRRAQDHALGPLGLPRGREPQSGDKKGPMK